MFETIVGGNYQGCHIFPKDTVAKLNRLPIDLIEKTEKRGSLHNRSNRGAGNWTGPNR